VLVTLSEDGMLLPGEGPKARSLRRLIREVRDVSGAGDTVVAGALVLLASGR
jgi:bifunctional ADP-heptose synthase (sugar kinase/adenylyltransferase)